MKNDLKGKFIGFKSVLPAVIYFVLESEYVREGYYNLKWLESSGRIGSMKNFNFGWAWEII